MTRTLAAALVLAAACAPERESRFEPLRVAVAARDGGTRLILVPAPGLRINARLLPALELTGGGVVRFRSTHLTPDSAYFTVPPVAFVPGTSYRPHGRLRASVCDSGATVCRAITIQL